MEFEKNINLFQVCNTSAHLAKDNDMPQVDDQDLIKYCKSFMVSLICESIQIEEKKKKTIMASNRVVLSSINRACNLNETSFTKTLNVILIWANRLVFVT